MSRDYKIGIVVALLVIIGGLVYHLMTGSSQPAPATQPAESQETEVVLSPQPVEPDEDEVIQPVPLASAEPAETVTPTRWEQATTQSSEDTADVVTPVVTPLEDDQPTESPGWNLAGTDRPSADDQPTEPTGQQGESGYFKLDPDVDLAVGEQQPPPTITPVRPPEPVDLAGQETYTVQQGDLGFYYIAEKVYGSGKGKYWKRIRDANPGVDTNALRVGMKLKIPPLESASSPGRSGAASVPTLSVGNSGETSEPARREGAVFTNAQGQKVYVVSKDDTAGLWGIAAKSQVYGKGYLWKHIQNANPAVDPMKLRAGQQLVIPPLPTRTATGASTGRASASTPRSMYGRIVTENGKRYYIVQPGDEGFWGVAQRVYDNGNYFTLIEKANPGVNSDLLQPGDRLHVPPPPVDTTPTRRPPRPRREPASVQPSGGAPDFGP